ncbi:pilus assembly protein TadG-related protein [Alicyclobacillus sp. SO9]|uniref:pilus assembly protein TadG-related protein n=1 Tax=Alicyclobacillus sp. SO9 TaxID=2665646 RepID=UPI0018E8978B|nr:pilus assembly protein TadG-related protein [Alicyclobacillus sp. SO9]QQE79450.1 hypothetical protein GI364_02820 [Alicyclobacillus sp. SO9]
MKRSQMHHSCGWLSALFKRLVLCALYRWHREESGNVLVLTALSFVALCGFGALVVDAGMLDVQYRKAQSGADAAALAGAQQLLQGAKTAAQTAVHYGLLNDQKVTYQATADIQTNTVSVAGKATSPLWFARVLGKNTASYQVNSKAAVGTLVSGVGMVPIAVTKQTLVYGQTVILTSGAGGGSAGNYGFLDFSGNGAKGVECDLEHGYDFPMHVGETVSTETGVMKGPVEQAIEYRLHESCDDSACNSFATATSDCSRVMYLPVINALPQNGKKQVTILGFAAFFLEGLQGKGGHQEIVGRFIQMVRPGTLGQGTNYGTYAVKLEPSAG